MRQGRDGGRELEAEARQTKFEARPRRGRAKSTLFVSFWYHAQCTCSSYVFLLCGQWHLSMKNTTEKFHKKSISNTRPSQDRGRNYEAEPRPRQWSRTEARPCEAEARPSQLKKMLRGRLEPRQMPRGLHPCIPMPFLRSHTHTSGPVPMCGVCVCVRWHDCVGLTNMSVCM